MGIFCLSFRHPFFRHFDFSRFEISKKNFFSNLDFRYHRKMYRLFPSVPIFREFFDEKCKKDVYI